MNSVKFLDGALGTSLWEMSNTKGNVWELNMTNQEIVFKLHKMYIEAGSDIIASNTFSVNAMSVKDTNYSVSEVVCEGIKIAKNAVKGTAVKVAFDIGPLTELLEPYGDLTEDECEETYREIIESGIKENPDIIFFETFMDIEMLKIAVSVANKFDIPVFCSMTFEKIGKTIMGNSIDDMLGALSEFNVFAVGLNCSNEPSSLIDVIKSFRTKTNKPLIFKPNAGLPQQKDGKSIYKSDIDVFAEDMLPSIKLGEIYIGGCCGTNPSYIQKLKDLCNTI